MRMSTEQTKSIYYQELLNALSSKKSFQDIVNIASRHLGNPISITNASYRILASSLDKSRVSEEHLNNPLYQIMSNTIDQKKWGTNTVEYLKTSNRYDLCIHSSEAHILDKEYFEKQKIPFICNFLDCGIRIKGVFVGMLTVCDLYTPLKPEHIGYCNFLSNIISMIFSRELSMVYDSNLIDSLFMKDCIDGKIHDALHIKLRAKELTKTPKKYMRVMVLQSDNDIAGNIALFSVYNITTTEFFQTAISLLYDDQIIILLSSDVEDHIEEQLLKEHAFLDFLESNHLIAGVSNSFTSIEKIKRFYQQAANANRHGKTIHPNKKIYYFYQYSFYQVLASIENQYNLLDLCHPIILGMAESSHASDLDSLKILFLWLFCNKNTNTIVELSGIKRGTVFYRLNKLRSLIPENMDTKTTMMQLMISFKILYVNQHTAQLDIVKWMHDLPSDIVTL